MITDTQILETLAHIGHKIVDKAYKSLGIKRTFEIGFDKERMGVVEERKVIY